MGLSPAPTLIIWACVGECACVCSHTVGSNLSYFLLFTVVSYLVSSIMEFQFQWCWYWNCIMTSLHHFVTQSISITTAQKRLYRGPRHCTFSWLNYVSLCSISFSRLSLLQQLACNELKEMLHCSSLSRKRTLHILCMIQACITCLYRGPVYTKSLVP